MQEEKTMETPMNEPETQPMEPEQDDAVSIDLNTALARLQEMEQALEEQKNLYLRTLADFQNYRRRQNEEMERQRIRVLETLLEDLLPILDNFERALQAAEATRELEPLLEGVKMTDRQIKALLARFDIHPIEAVGKPFDPNLHEAIQRVESEEYEDGTIIDEVERGYRMGERVIRPSKVIVARRPEPPTEYTPLDIEA
ncbi:MAG: nucleotide exchange factor GrpE [Armatimonadetes bacterium]|nr:nucleotide exchange factor GrpE [Armatimonadota bacterium]CUU36495.1 molecular chaperone GrpE [Armatimonadetes bacterium DC]